MKISLSFCMIALFSFITAASAQTTITLPTCATNCVFKVLSQSTCLLDDITCYCQDVTFGKALKACVDTSCSAADIATTHNDLVEECAAVGINFGTVASTAASTSSTSPAAVAPAAGASTSSADASTSQASSPAAAASSSSPGSNGLTPTTIYSTSSASSPNPTGSGDSGSDTSGTTTTKAKKSKTPIGAVVGGVVGGIAVIAVAIALWFWGRHSGKKKAAAAAAAAGPASNEAAYTPVAPTKTPGVQEMPSAAPTGYQPYAPPPATYGSGGGMPSELYGNSSAPPPQMTQTQAGYGYAPQNAYEMPQNGGPHLPELFGSGPVPQHH